MESASGQHRDHARRGSRRCCPRNAASRSRAPPPRRTRSHRRCGPEGGNPWASDLEGHRVVEVLRRLGIDRQDEAIREERPPCAVLRVDATGAPDGLIDHLDRGTGPGAGGASRRRARRGQGPPRLREPGPDEATQRAIRAASPRPGRGPSIRPARSMAPHWRRIRSGRIGVSGTTKVVRASRTTLPVKIGVGSLEDPFDDRLGTEVARGTTLQASPRPGPRGSRPPSRSAATKTSSPPSSGFRNAKPWRVPRIDTPDHHGTGCAPRGGAARRENSGIRLSGPRSWKHHAHAREDWPSSGCASCGGSCGAASCACASRSSFSSASSHSPSRRDPFPKNARGPPSVRPTGVRNGPHSFSIQRPAESSNLTIGVSTFRCRRRSAATLFPSQEPVAPPRAPPIFLVPDGRESLHSGVTGQRSRPASRSGSPASPHRPGRSPCRSRPHCPVDRHPRPARPTRFPPQPPHQAGSTPDAA